MTDRPKTRAMPWMIGERIGDVIAAMAEAFIARPHPAERFGLRETTHKRHRGWGTINRDRREQRRAHVARVREFSRRSAAYFAKHGHKPPRSVRGPWTAEIAASVR